MTPEEVHLIRKQIALVGFTSVALLILTLSIVVSALGAPLYYTYGLLAISGGTMAVPWAQLNDGKVRRVVEYLYGQPDTPYYNDLKEEVSLDV